MMAGVLANGCRKPVEPPLQPPSVGSELRGVNPTSQNESPKLPTVSGTAFQSDSEALAPASDQWPSEAFAERAANVLQSFKSQLLNGVKREEVSRSSLFAATFSYAGKPEFGGPVRFRDDVLIFRDRNVDSTEIIDTRSAAINAFVTLLTQPESEHQSTVQHAQSYPAPLPSYLKIKVIGVDWQTQSADTVLRAEAHWKGSSFTAQTTTIWNARWTDVGETPRMSNVQLTSIETTRSSQPPWFVDSTMAVIGETQAFRLQLQFGIQHWLARIGTAHGMNYFTKHGLAVADINGDGRDDLYVCQPGGLPNRLFLQQADGHAIECAAKLGLDFLDRTSSAIFVDLDNDGDQDAALATLMGVMVLENIENQHFRLRQRIDLPDIDLQGLSAVDYDNDGDLDLYQLVDYSSGASQQGLPRFVYHDAKDGGANRLFDNGLNSVRGRARGAFQFRDVTRQVGLDVNNRRHSLAAAWEDFDQDGDQDLYVANDYGPNSLFQNIGGRFVDIADSANARNFGSGMSVSWADYDRDGNIDLYVGNMFSSAGSRLTNQAQFLPDVGEENRQVYQQFARGNTLLRRAESRFDDVTIHAGVGMGRWSWSSLFADIDNDGWQDLLVSNGYITTEDTGDL